MGSEGPNNSHIRAFAQDALRVRIMRACGSQTSITASMIWPPAETVGSTETLLSTIGLTRSTALAKLATRSVKSLSILHSLNGGLRASQKINEPHR
jgi:hypothetical protein